MFSQRAVAEYESIITSSNGLGRTIIMWQTLRQSSLVSNLIPLCLAAVLSIGAAHGMTNVESKVESKNGETSGVDANVVEANIASVVPTAEDDKWLQIPWHTNLMQARLDAQRLHCPLFLWGMNGNPMGCI